MTSCVLHFVFVTAHLSLIPPFPSPGHQGFGELRRRAARGVQALRDAQGAREAGIPEGLGPGEEGEGGAENPGDEGETSAASEGQRSGE